MKTEKRKRAQEMIFLRPLWLEIVYQVRETAKESAHNLGGGRAKYRTKEATFPNGVERSGRGGIVIFDYFLEMDIWLACSSPISR